MTTGDYRKVDRLILTMEEYQAATGKDTVPTFAEYQALTGLHADPCKHYWGSALPLYSTLLANAVGAGRLTVEEGVRLFCESGRDTTLSPDNCLRWIRPQLAWMLVHRGFTPMEEYDRASPPNRAWPEPGYLPA